MSIYWRLLFGIFYGVLLRVYTYRLIYLIYFPPLFFFPGDRGGGGRGFRIEDLSCGREWCLCYSRGGGGEWL